MTVTAHLPAGPDRLACLWLQGMREDAERPYDRDAISWMELLFRRLTGRFAGLTQGSKTAVSEEKLRLGTNVYYFVGRCIPQFGHNIVCSETGEQEEAAVVPFDTGGLAHDHLRLSRPLKMHERRRVVKRESRTPLDHVPAFATWVENAYPAGPSSYVQGEAPEVSAVAEVRIDNDSRAWTWEARLRSIDYPRAPVDPVRIHLKPGDTDRYFRWLTEYRPMSLEETKSHIRSVASVTMEDDVPIRAMLTYLSLEVAT